MEAGIKRFVAVFLGSLLVVALLAAVLNQGRELHAEEPSAAIITAI